MDKKRVQKDHPVDNGSGILGMNFGILSLVFTIAPILGIILGCIGLYFGYQQKKMNPNYYSRMGIGFSVFGIVISIVMLAWMIPKGGLA